MSIDIEVAMTALKIDIELKIKTYEYMLDDAKKMAAEYRQKGFMDAEEAYEARAHAYEMFIKDLHQIKVSSLKELETVLCM